MALITSGRISGIKYNLGWIGLKWAELSVSNIF